MLFFGKTFANFIERCHRIALAHVDDEVKIHNAYSLRHYLSCFLLARECIIASMPLNLPSSRKCVANHISALLSTRASAILNAMARPSRVLVPRPSSSMIARLFRSIFLDRSVSVQEARTNEYKDYLKINAVSLISDAKVETFASILSSIDTRANS